MTTSTDYREFALDCLQHADDARDFVRREMLIGFARILMRTASEIDQQITLANNAPLVGSPVFP